MSQCLFCSSIESVGARYPTITFNNKSFDYRRCIDCSLVYISPLLNADDLQKLYSGEYHDEFYFNATREYPEQKNLLRKYKPTGKILDYGCGDASFLRYLENEGYERYGAEYSSDLVEKLRTTFPAIQFKTISSVLESDDEKYDIIHLGDVLEHLLNPKEIITLLKERLLPGGVLFVEGPIEHNFHLSHLPMALYFKLRKWVQPKRVVAVRPFHVLFANAKNQKSFFEQIGISALHYQIFEWAWPFPDQWKKAKSVKQKGEYVVAKASVSLSKIFKGWGNRFYYIGTPVFK